MSSKIKILFIVLFLSLLGLITSCSNSEAPSDISKEISTETLGY